MQFSIDFLKFIYQHLGLHPLFDKEPEKLANGINPLTGESINDDEIINNVRISRCLFYVKGVLDEVIKNGGVNKSVSKRKKLPFTISNEELANFEFTDEELSISMIVKKINDLQPNEEISKLRASVVISWLVSIGLLYEDNINGRKTKKSIKSQNKIRNIK